MLSLLYLISKRKSIYTSMYIFLVAKHLFVYSVGIIWTRLLLWITSFNWARCSSFHLFEMPFRPWREYGVWHPFLLVYKLKCRKTFKKKLNSTFRFSSLFAFLLTTFPRSHKRYKFWGQICKNNCQLHKKKHYKI